MLLMLGMAKKCNELEVRHRINIRQRGQEQTGKIDLARVTSSYLENNKGSDDN